MNSSKLFLFSILVFGVVVLLSGVGSSLQCNTTNNYINSSSISNGCVLTTAGLYTMSGETFSLEGNSSGAFIINGNNIVLNGNGSKLLGNTSNNFIGLRTATKSNISIYNIMVFNYSIGASLESNAVNISISNSSFDNINSSINLRLFTNGKLESLNISNNIFNNNGIFNSNSNTGTSVVNNSYFNSNIFNNTVWSIKMIMGKDNIFSNNLLTNSSFSFSFQNSTNISLTNNFIYSTGIYGWSWNSFTLFEQSRNFYIGHNFYNGSEYGIRLDSSVSNITIYNNTAVANDYGIGNIYGTNINVSHNYQYNTNFTAFDGYWVGIEFVNCTGSCYLTNNRFDDIINGIHVMHADNLLIRDNIFNTLSYSLRNKTLGGSVQIPPPIGVNNGTSAMCALNIEPLFNSWLGHGLDFASNNISNFTVYESTNITILNNSFNGNEQCYLKSQNVLNLVHDLSNYWNIEFAFPTRFYNPQKYFINNNFENLIQSTNQSQSDLLYFNYRGGNRLDGGVKIYKNYTYFININLTQIYNSNLYNLTNSLIYFSNGSVACSNIPTCDNNINITLTPNNYSYVLDNFNLTEGITRQFSPLSISGSSTSKTITSSLTQSITATVVVNVDGCSFNPRYEGQPIENNNCNGDTATFTLEDIPSGESTLLLSSADINCSANVSAGSTIILVFTALAIMGIALFLVIKRDELTIQILLVAFISIMVGIALFIQIAQNLGGACA